MCTQQQHNAIKIGPICLCKHLDNKISSTYLLSNGMHAIQQQQDYLISVIAFQQKTHLLYKDEKPFVCLSVGTFFGTYVVRSFLR